MVHQKIVNLIRKKVAKFRQQPGNLKDVKHDKCSQQLLNIDKKKFPASNY